VKKLGRPAAAIAIMGGIIAILLTLCTPRSVSRKSAIDSASAPTPKP
jgi:hypothetical protein